MKLYFHLLLLPLLLSIPLTLTADDTNIILKTPPASLEQWYKPANKRQVWLHTMFRLRREMQAIEEYARLDDRKAMQKWIQRLDKDYSKITDMVPEWEKEIKPRLLSELEMFADKGDTGRLLKTLDMLQRTCDDCHDSYQPQVTAIYRSPEYNTIKLNSEDGQQQSFEENMKALSVSVNRILIALDDGHNPAALQASRQLDSQLQELGKSCTDCHKKDSYPRERILGKDTRQRFVALQSNISEGRVRDSQKMMGEIAVTVCARCHNTHRIVNDLRESFISEQ